MVQICCMYKAILGSGKEQSEITEQAKGDLRMERSSTETSSPGLRATPLHPSLASPVAV